MFDFSYWIDKANEFRDNGKYHEAIECYEEILNYYPRSAHALTMIGSCYSDLKQFNNALTYMNKAIDIDPNESFLWFNRGVVYFDNKRYEDALKDFDKAILLKPDDSISWYFKGWCYFYLNDIPKSIESFEISCDIKYDRETINIINDLKRMSPNTKICPNCGRKLSASAINCGFCGHSLNSGTVNSTNNNSNSSFTRCPNCGTFVRKNKKVCPKCNYNFKKSKVNKPKIDKSKLTKPKIDKPVNIKHFDDGVVSFDYADNYSKDFNSKYKDLNILASFRIGSRNNFESSFAVFDGQPLSDKIPDSKFKETIRKSLNSDILEINRYVSGEKERIIIEIRNNTNNNLEYYCTVPEIGFSVLFIIPYGKEHLFNKKFISTVVDSLEKSSGESISKPKDSSTRKSKVKKPVIKEKIKTCPNCGSENPDDSNFCMECGMKLDISNDVNFCIHCGTEVIPGAKFCMNCGKLIEY